MLSWMISKLWDILVFLIVSSVCIGGYKMIRSIINSGVEGFQERLDNFMEERERQRMLKNYWKGRR